MPGENSGDRGTLEQKQEEVSQDFDAVFDEASAAVDSGTAVTDKIDEDTPAAVVEDGEKPKPVEQEVKPAAPQPPADDASFEHKYKTLQGIHKHDREVWEEEKGTLLTRLETLEKAQVAPAKGDTGTTEEKKAESASDLLHAFIDSLTDEQKAQLKEYDEEFDVISKMEGLKREAAFKQLKKELDDFKNEVKSQLQPATDFVVKANEERETADEAAHFDAIKEAHPDFEKYRDDGSLTKWIESKPVYMQGAIKKVCEAGTFEDVIQVLDDFKRDNNIVTEKQETNVVHISKEKEARKQAMTSPVTRRGSVNVNTADAQDYESSFDEAINKQGG
jgi:vacuolar-type H+-ATPase subunit I/STV1